MSYIAQENQNCLNNTLVLMVYIFDLEAQKLILNKQQKLSELFKHLRGLFII